MIVSRPLDELNLRSAPAIAGENIIGQVRKGAILYVVGDPVTAADIAWANVAGPCTDGRWRTGYCATGFGGTVLLVAEDIAPRFGSPILSPKPITQLFAENPAFYAQPPMNYVGHNGLDLGTPEGTPIFAIGVGRVAQSRFDSGYGHYVRIDHAGGAISLYAHLSSCVVREGESVYEGGLIGISGNTGFSSGPHLHFELRVPPIDGNNGYGGRVDPLPFIDRQYLIWPGYAPGGMQHL